MIIKVIIISVILLVIAGLGFGIRALFDKNASLPTGSCCMVDNGEEGFSCACEREVPAKNR